MTKLYIGDLVREPSITTGQEKKLLYRLACAGMISRVRRGMYLVPSKPPLDGGGGSASRSPRSRAVRLIPTLTLPIFVCDLVLKRSALYRFSARREPGSIALQSLFSPPYNYAFPRDQIAYV